MSTIQTEFSNKINFWGRITMGIGIAISLGAPLYMMFAYQLFPGWDIILTAFLAVGAVVVVNWIIEPLTYFPMLGVAGTYQAWLVGNISNKLLPAAITAQGAVGVKPGTKKAEIVAISAISGAVIVHVITLVLLVGIGGTFIISVMPEHILKAFDYILPAILGPVLVQLFFTVKNGMMTIAALAVTAALTFLVVPMFPAFGSYGLITAVVLVVAISLLLYKKFGSKEEIEQEEV